MCRSVVSFFALVVLVGAASPAVAGDQWSSPYPGVRYLERTTSSPNRVHAVEVDLCATGVTPTVTRPGDRGMRTSAFAGQYGAQIAVNAGFYNTSNYAPIGLTMGEGQLWTDSGDGSSIGFVAFGEENEVVLSEPSAVVSSPADWMHNIVAGKPMIVDNGQVVANQCLSHWCQRHPRTAIGVDATGKKLILAVVDGRWSGVSRGMTTAELGQLMVDLGAEHALNLDGGGSTTMFVDGLGGVVNNPSDGSERTVSNHLGLLAGGPVDYAHCCIPEAKDGATGTFADIPDTSWMLDIVETMYSEGLTNGCQQSPRMFCPHCDLDRAHAAIFMARALGLAPASPAQPTFEDVPPGAPGFGEIEALHAAGYINGCSQDPMRFCPDEWLSRGTAAVLITRAMGVDPGSPSAPVFTDVSADAWYRDHVEFLHEACVVNGCSQSPREYCPNDIVTRIQFGAMLVRSLEVGAFDNCLPDDAPGGDAGVTPDTGAPAEDVGSPQDAAGSQDVGEPQPDAAQPAPDVSSGGDIGQDGRGSSVAATGGCDCNTSGGGPGGAAGLVVVGWLVARVWRRGKIG